MRLAGAVAVGCAFLAVLLLVRPPSRLTAGPGRLSRSTVGLALPATALLAALAVPQAAGLVLVLAAAAAGALGLWRRRRRRRSAEHTAAQVLETCELLAGELAAGRPPGDALDRAAAAWPPLAPAAAAFRMGADVPATLRDLAASVPGAADLRVVGAAWEVGHRTGQGLSAAVDRVAESLRAAAATRRVVTGELASARATARLVAGMPVLALAMGSGAGGDPWAFLLNSPAGLVCLAGGLAFGLAGLWWIEAIAAHAEGGR
jgi:tight adherence protein B